MRLQINHLAIGPRVLPSRVVLDEAFDGLTEVRSPGIATELAIREDRHADLALLRKRIENCSVFDVPQRLTAQLARAGGDARLPELRRPSQASDLIGAISHRAQPNIVQHALE